MSSEHCTEIQVAASQQERNLQTRLMFSQVSNRAAHASHFSFSSR